MTELPGPPLAETSPWTALLSAQRHRHQFGHLKGAPTAVVSTGYPNSYLAVLLLDQALGFLDALVELLDVAGLGL